MMIARLNCPSSIPPRRAGRLRFCRQGLLFQKNFHLRQKLWHMFDGYVPNHVQIKLVVTVNQSVSHADNLPQVREPSGHGGILFAQMNERLANDRQLTLNRRL